MTGEGTSLESYKENKDGNMQKVTKYGVWNSEKLARKKKMAHPGSYST
jgi:hypothetical protein